LSILESTAWSIFHPFTLPKALCKKRANETLWDRMVDEVYEAMMGYLVKK
jgi:hypothetical protein